MAAGIPQGSLIQYDLSQKQLLGLQSAASPPHNIYKHFLSLSLLAVSAHICIQFGFYPPILMSRGLVSDEIRWSSALVFVNIVIWKEKSRSWGDGDKMIALTLEMSKLAQRHKEVGRRVSRRSVTMPYVNCQVFLRFNFPFGTNRKKSLLSNIWWMLQSNTNAQVHLQITRKVCSKPSCQVYSHQGH